MFSGLFRAAASFSGNAFSDWAAMKNPKEQAKRFGEKLNCTQETSHGLVSCLQDLDAWTIVKSHVEIQVCSILQILRNYR